VSIALAPARFHEPYQVEWNDYQSVCAGFCASQVAHGPLSFLITSFLITCGFTFKITCDYLRKQIYTVSPARRLGPNKNETFTL
jgi:hypothetical protein